MDKDEKIDINKEFFSNQKVVENYSLLEEIGVFSYVEHLSQKINDYKNLFVGALDIVNRPTINEILDATVWQISDYFLPSYIAFIWKPIQNREDITIKCYKNYKLVELNLHIESISSFEPFFAKFPEPVYFEFFTSVIGRDKNIQALEAIEPELIIPILGPSWLYGIVLLGNNILGDGFSPHELSFVENLMQFVSKSINSHLHYEQTLRDEKTGLFNNGFFMTRLNEEIVKVRRARTETSVIIMDVDHFKSFNDTYGHLAGDRVLETLAITLKQGVRVGDVPSRFGGEEFTVLLPDTEIDMALIVAERLRDMVQNMKVDWEPSLPQVTISLGISSFHRESNISAELVLERADAALYQSKKHGRNRTTLWDSDSFEKMDHKKQEGDLK